MKLSKITATNFKGSSFSYSLAPVTAFVGGNFKGKTRVLDAIIVALLGYHPSLGKSAKATFGLASGRDMEVRLEFEMGPTVRRRFYLKGDTVKVDEDLPEAWDQVAEQLPVMLDASLYFSLTDRQRVDYVFANCTLPGGWDPITIMGRVEKKALGEFSKEKFGDWLERLMGDAKNDDLLKPQAFVEFALDRFTVLWKESKAHAERMEKTIQGMSELRAQDEAGLPLATLETMAGQLARSIAELNENKGRLMSAFTEAKSAKIRRDEIDRELRFGLKTANDLLDARNKAALLEKAIADMPVILQTEIQRFWAVVCSHKTAADGLNTESIRQIKEKERAERLLADMDTKTCCPYCGAAGVNWKALNAAELATAIDEAKTAAETAQTKLKEVRRDMEAAVLEHTRAMEAQGARGKLETELALLEMTINRLDGTNVRAKLLQEEQARLPVEDPALTAKVETLQSELNVKNEELRGVDAQLRKAQGRKLELQRLASAEKERDEARLEQDVTKTAGTELRVIQAEMVATAFLPLVEKANSLFGTVLRSPLAYNAAEGGEIGMWVGGQWVGHHTFSGTEKALTYAAFQMALASTGPLRLMLLDEMGRLDDLNAGRVLATLGLATKNGMVDGAVIIDAGRWPMYAMLKDETFQAHEIT